MGVLCQAGHLGASDLVVPPSLGLFRSHHPQVGQARLAKSLRAAHLVAASLAVVSGWLGSRRRLLEVLEIQVPSEWSPAVASEAVRRPPGCSDATCETPSYEPRYPDLLLQHLLLLRKAALVLH